MNDSWVVHICIITMWDTATCKFLSWDNLDKNSKMLDVILVKQIPKLVYDSFSYTK